MFIIDICHDPALAHILSIFRNILDVVQIAGPIAAIVGGVITLTKLMSDPDNKKMTNAIRNWVIALLLFLLVPTIVNITMNLIGESTEVSSCWNSVR